MVYLKTRKSEDKFDNDIYIMIGTLPAVPPWQVYILRVNGFSFENENQRIKYINNVIIRNY